MHRILAVCAACYLLAGCVVAADDGYRNYPRDTRWHNDYRYNDWRDNRDHDWRDRNRDRDHDHDWRR